MCAAVAAMMMAVTLQSCEKEDVITGENVAMSNTIKVEAMIADNVATKAAAAKYATEDNLNSFQLGIFAGQSQVTNSKFEKPTVKGNPWSDGNTYYWAKDTTYKFYGVAQSTGDNADAYGSSSISVKGIEFKDRNITADEDLIVAYASGKQGTTQVTKLVFNHALARVRVAAKFSTPADAVKLQAKFVGWELKNVSTKGSVVIDGTSTGKTTADVVWTPDATKANVSDAEASTSTSAFLDSDYRIVTGAKVEDNQENTNARWADVIPNATVYADELVATVEFYTAEGNYIATRKLHASTDEDAVAKLTYADKFCYKSGKAYTYKIDIVNDGGNSTDPTDDPKNLDDYKIQIKEITVTEWSCAEGGKATFGK